jgi:uncharacterized membrane protein
MKRRNFKKPILIILVVLLNIFMIGALVNSLSNNVNIIGESTSQSAS